jgi:hypothetical protein
MDFSKLYETQANVPRPFPGRYPTRIRVNSRDGAYPFTYEGKPVPQILGMVRNQFFRKGGISNNLSFVEFDQNGYIRWMPETGGWRVAPFADIYFPIPKFLLQFQGRTGKLFLMLCRKREEIKGRRLYVNNFISDSGAIEKSFMSMATRAAAGKEPSLGWSAASKHDFMDQLNEKLANWSRRYPEVEGGQLPPRNDFAPTVRLGFGRQIPQLRPTERIIRNAVAEQERRNFDRMMAQQAALTRVAPQWITNTTATGAAGFWAGPANVVGGVPNQQVTTNVPEPAPFWEVARTDENPW